METIASAVWFFSGGVLTYARYFGLKLGARGMRVTKRATAAEMATLRGLKGEITAEGFQRREGEQHSTSSGGVAGGLRGGVSPASGQLSTPG